MRLSIHQAYAPRSLERDLNATSPVEIGTWAFYRTGLQCTLVIPSGVTKIGTEAFYGTELTGLDLSGATSLVEIGQGAFSDTNLEGTLVIPPTVATVGDGAFEYSKLTRLDLSKATSLMEIDLSKAPSLVEFGDGVFHSVFRGNANGS